MWWTRLESRQILEATVVNVRVGLGDQLVQPTSSKIGAHSPVPIVIRPLMAVGLVGSSLSSYQDCGGRCFDTSFSSFALFSRPRDRFLGRAFGLAPVDAIHGVSAGYGRSSTRHRDRDLPVINEACIRSGGKAT